MKMKKILCLVLVVLFSMTGCTRETAVGTTGNNNFGSTVEESIQGVTEVVSSGSFSMPINTSYGWDPYSCTSMENRAVMQLIYEGLFTLTPSFDAEPVLCSEYTVSSNGMLYTLTLQNATFSDGRSLTAEDVIYSYKKAAESDIYKARFRDVNDMVADGSNTVLIYLSNPNDRLPCMLDFPIIPNLSATTAPLGTGPFVMDGVSSLARNTSWWQGADTISINSIGLYSSNSAEDTRDNFEIDTIQIVFNDPNSSTAATYHCDYELWNSKGTVMQYMGFNMDEGVFQDSRLRSAVLKAIDRSEITESIYHNFADAAVLPVSPVSSMYYEDLARMYSYNREEALEELMASGSFYLPDDHPVVTGAIFDKDYDSEADANQDTSLMEEEDSLLDEDTELPDHTDTDETETVGYNAITMLVMSGNIRRQEAAEMVAEDLTNVGFTVDLQVMEYDEFIYTINNVPDAWDLYYVDASLTPDFDLRSILYPGYKLNYNTVPVDETLNSLYYKALENTGNRYDLYEYLMSKAYICPILFQNNAVFTTRGVFTGLNPAPGNLFYEISNVIINN